MLASVLLDIGAEAAAIAAIVGCLALIARARPVKWLWRRIVGEPATTWLRAEVEHVVEGALAPIRAELKPNGGSSLRDRVDHVEGVLRALAEDVKANRRRNEAQDAAAGDPDFDADPGAADRAAEATAQDP